jgi:leucyl aminopeptidase (aminopeptidase T)
MDNRIAEIVKVAMKPYQLNLTAGQRVLIVTDTGTDPLVTQAFMAAALALDIEPVVVMQPPAAFHHAELSPLTVAAMADADIIHLCTSKAAIHSGAVHKLMKSGKRFIASEEITVEMMRQGAATADYDKMNTIGQQIYEIMHNGRRLRVTSGLGTDLTADITNRPAWLAAGRVMDNPGCDLSACGFPDGEVGVAPIEESIQGVVVWDTSMHHVGLINEPIRAEIKDGRAVSIKGGAEAQRLLDFLHENGDEGSWIIGETAVGINDRARVTGLVREDKKLGGCSHIALGTNTDVGGRNPSRTHLDGIVRRPTWQVDDTVVIREGKILLGVT